MGTSWSSPVLPVGAQFASNNPSSVASYSTCHVFGDPGLYGVGIRTGYYLQYAAAVLSLLCLPPTDQQLWLLSFLPLAAASLVGLSLNTTEGGLVVLDWVIVFGLVSWSLFFLAWPVLRRASRTGPLGSISDPKQLRQDLEKDGGRPVTDQEAQWHARYAAVIRAATADEHRRGSRNHEPGEKLPRLETALRTYVTSFASARFSPASVGASSYVLDLYADGQLPDLAARMLTDNAQLESFRDGHTEALRRANVPFAQAQSTTQTLGRLAMDGPRPGDASYPGSPWWYTSLLTSGTPRPIASGLALILYSGFSALTVWLLFLAADHGSHPPCDIRFIFVVVPTSAYNPRAVTALRVLASIWLAVAAIPTLAIGSALLITGTMAWWDQGIATTVPTTPPPSRPRRYEAEKGKETEIISPTRSSRTSKLLYEMDELQFPMHHRSASSPTTVSSFRDTRISSYHSGSVFTKDTIEPIMGPASSAGGVDIRGGLGDPEGRKSWAAGKSKPVWAGWGRGVLLMLPLVHTVVVVEVTISINEMDMRRRPMTTMAELLAFFMGLGVFVGVLGRCLRASRGREARRRWGVWEDERREVLLAPATRLGGEAGGSWYGGSGGFRREAESGLSKEVEVGRREGVPKQGRRIYLQPERKSGSSMGKFREMIDEDGV